MLDAYRVTLPRQILPGTFYLLTRRCVQRQFLFRPDEETNNAYAYCLAEAAERFQIELIAAQMMSNHHHVTLFDRFGRVIEFTAHLHGMLAKCQNALRGRWENAWSTESPSLVELIDPEDVIAKAVYTATNPVLDDLVDRVDHWPGPKTVPALLRQVPLEAVRPHYFFRDDGPMPDRVSLRFVIPAELGEHDVVLAGLRERIAAVESQETHRRNESGKRIVGRRGILRQSWRESPVSREPRRNLKPRVAARWKWSRLEALRRNREFVDAYRAARTAWLTKRSTIFPAGTYWLARFAGVPVANVAN